MKRISRRTYFMRVAALNALRSTCNRMHVGALIVKDHRIVSTGYNGAPKGSAHCSSETCNPNEPCLRTIHAEANAIYFAAKHGVSLEGCTLYSTHSPCINCAHAIIQSGITEVIYMEPYRDLLPVELMEKADIKVIHYGEDQVQDLLHSGASEESN